MHYKSTSFQDTAQQLLSGNLQQAPGVKFFRVPGARTIKWSKNKKAMPFSKLCPTLFAVLANAYNSNPHAREALERDNHGNRLSFERRVELYTYFTAESLGLPTPGVSFKERLTKLMKPCS